MPGIPRNGADHGRGAAGFIVLLLLLSVGELFAAAPFAHTQAASLVRSNSAVLNGMAVPGGQPAIAWFEWGPRGSFTQSTTPIGIGNGTKVESVTSPIGGLIDKGVYQCRLVVSNASGVVSGATRWFTTSRRIGIWGMDLSGQLLVPTTLTNTVAIAAGYFHDLALTADGRVVSWGFNGLGQTNVPANLTNAAMVAGGGHHSLALRSTGTVVAWGDNPISTNLLPGLTNVVDLDGGYEHSLALQANGIVRGWGSSSYDQTNFPPGLSNVVSVSCGDHYNLVLKADGTVVAAGSYLVNDMGPWIPMYVPAGLSNVTMIAAGGQHAVALRADRTVTVWGDNGSTQTNLPAGLSNIVAVAAGYYHTLALREDGIVIAWGGGFLGANFVPDGLSNVVAVAAGYGSSLVLRDNYPAQAFDQTVTGVANTPMVVTLSGTDADNDPFVLRIASLPQNGALFQFNNGNPGPAILSPNTTVTDSSNRVVFVPATNGFGIPYDSFTFTANDGSGASTPAIVTINLPGPRVFTLKTTRIGPNGAALNGVAVPNGLATTAWFEWGAQGGYGQVTPAVNVGAGSGIVRVRAELTNLTAGAAYQCRLVLSNAGNVFLGRPELFTTGERVLGWGNNNSVGELTPPAGLTNAVAIAAGGALSVALRADGTVAAWGLKHVGQTNVLSGLSDVIAISSGVYHSLALKSNGTVTAWGVNTSGQTNVPPLTNAVAIAAGAYHSMALQSNGIVVGWGDNYYGQAIAPTDVSNVVDIACGRYHTMALLADGTIRGWGQNYYGQTDTPANVSNVVAIAAGDEQSMALLADGKVVVWGNYYYGQTVVPPGLSNVVAMAAGGAAIVALQINGTVVAWGNSAEVPAGVANVFAIAASFEHRLAIGNAQPQALSQVARSPANSDLVIALETTDSNSDLLSLRVMTLPAQGGLYQFDAGIRGPLIVSPNTLVTDPGHRVIFVPGTNQFGTPYAAFDFNASDGVLTSSNGTVIIHIHGARAFTQSSTGIRPTQATLNGMAVGNSFDSVAWFEWGERGSTNQPTPIQPVGSGTGTVRLSAAISNLLAGRTYQFRMVVSNAFGVSVGPMRWFTTGDRLAGWGSGATALPFATDIVAVAAGDDHSAALRSDGTVLAWGENSSGETNVPVGLSNVVAIACGWRNCVALRADGTLTGWGIGSAGQVGYPHFGQSVSPAGLSNVVAIAAGTYHTVALRADGTVVVWGFEYEDRTNQPPGLSNVVAVAAGWGHSVALRIDGTLVAWGVGGNNVPNDVSDAIDISAGQDYSLAARANGSIDEWGSNFNTTAPPAETNVVAVAAGFSHGLALRSDGTVAGWGSDYNNQATVPVGLTNMIAVAGGQSHSLAVGNAQPAARELLVFGAANHDLAITLAGFDANGDSLNFRIATLPAVGSLYQYAGGARGPAITVTNTPVTDVNGRVIFVPLTNQFASPYDTFKYVANDGTFDSSPAVVTVYIQSSRAFTRSATGIRPNLATLNGTALPNGSDCLAWFEWGQRGSFSQTTIPVSVGNGYTVVQVNAAVSNLITGASYQCRLVVSNAQGLVRGATQLFTTGDRVRSWGTASAEFNDPDLTNAVAMAGGASHSLVLRSDGTVSAYGFNDYGQTTVPPGLNNVVAVAAGTSHSLALRSDGTVAAWGAGQLGQTGYPHFGQSTVPPGLNDVIAVEAGFNYSIALRADGTIVAWGDNSSGQTNVPAGLDNVVAIAGSKNHNLALRADGTVTAWGSRTYTVIPFEPPFGLHDVVAVSAGDTHNLALLTNGTIAFWGQHYIEGSVLPVPAELTNTISIASGQWHSLALQANGTMTAWGSYNSSGQTTVPPGLVGVVAIAAGFYHNLVLGGAIRPDAISQVVTGPANQDLVIGLDATNASAPLTFTISSPPATGSLYQYNGGLRGALITAGAVVADPVHRVIYGPIANGSGNPYSSFSFTASEAAVVSLPASVTINILPPVAPTITSLTRQLSGKFQLAFAGHSNTTYCVWASTNLVDWEYLGIPTQPSPGAFQFIDASSDLYPRRFYRISTGCGTPTPQLNAANGFNNGAFDLRFSGGPYWTYRVWASTNLLNWEPIGIAEEIAPGQFRYLDTAAPELPRRFYRTGP